MPVWHEMWAPMWAAAEETGLVISFHVSEGGGATVGYEVKGLRRPDDADGRDLLADDLKLPLPPSAYFKRQICATFQKDFHGVRAMAQIAPDNVMWGSDYPHRDGTWSFSRKAIEEQFRDAPEPIARKMLWENVRRVYRIEG